MFALGFVCQVFDEMFKRKRVRKVGPSGTAHPVRQPGVQDHTRKTVGECIHVRFCHIKVKPTNTLIFYFIL